MSYSDIDIIKLKLKAIEVRMKIVRACFHAGSGHPGGSLSAADIITVLYDCFLDRKSEHRDKFILSKGHATPLLYSIYAQYDLINDEELKTFRKLGSRLQGHPSVKHMEINEVSTGSLGQGLSIASGICLGFRLDKKKAKVFTLLGDGEIQEGQVWEAAATAAQYGLSNLCAIVDHNGLQIDGYLKDVKEMENIADKFKAFNWDVIRINGHDYQQIIDAFNEFSNSDRSKPFAIIADTVKGSGISYMEDNAGWHGKAPNKEEYEKAIQELEALASALRKELEKL